MATAILMLSAVLCNWTGAVLWMLTMKYPWHYIRRAWLVRDLTMVGVLLVSGLLNLQTAMRVLQHEVAAAQIQPGRGLLALLFLIAPVTHYIANAQKQRAYDATDKG